MDELVTPKYNIDYNITLDETQIIKAIAIIMMIAHHLFWEHLEFGMGIVHLAIAGKVCVALFVFLSGYGMATSFPKEHPNKVKAFIFVLCKRYAKFFLNYWLIFAIMVPIGVFCFNRPLEAAYGENANIFTSLIKDILGLQSLSSYNITWWFNVIILALWLLFPFLYWAMKSSIVSVCVLLFLWINPNDILYVLHLIVFEMPTWLLSFTLGIFIALHMDRINRVLNLIPPHIVLIVSLIAALVLLYLRGVDVFQNFTTFQVDSFATIFIALTTVCICRATGRKYAYLQYVGKHAINMYLTHTFIIGYFFSSFIYGLKHPLLIFFVSVSLSLALSICIEFFKKKIRFYELQNKIIDAINNLGRLTTK